jgi:hypothetical protein
MATKQEKIDALELEIAELTVAISHIRKGGQSYEITSAAGAGTKRVVTFADYQTLINEKKQLNSELAALNGTRGAVLTPGW